MAKPELGTKRQCTTCGAKFYDLNKDPAVCPKCGTPFQAVALPMGRAAAAAAAVPRPRETEDAEVEAVGPELVSLDEVEAAEAGADPVVEDDADLAETETADDTFLEEEEGDDDVADLIDGDIEDDEEA
ncbi:MAG TPA: TIGR02300 family protein [Beijerinckiaceae bacterium]